MNRKFVVLEFNRNNLKLVEGIQHRHRVSILKTYKTIVPLEAINNNFEINPDQLASFLHELFAKLSIRNKKVAISIVNNTLLTQVDTFPKASLNDLRNMIDIYIEETFPVKRSDYFADYGILSKEQKQLLIRINILDKATVSGLYQGLEQANLIPVALLTHSGGLHQLLTNAQQINHAAIDPKIPYALLEFHQGVVNLSVFQDNNLVFNRDSRIDSTDSDEVVEHVIAFYQQQRRSLAQRDFKFLEPQHFYLAGEIKDPLKLRNILEGSLNKPVTIIRDLDNLTLPADHSPDIITELNAAGALLAIPRRRLQKFQYFDFFYLLKKQTKKKINRQAIVAGGLIISFLVVGYGHFLYYEKLRDARLRLDQLSEDLKIAQTNIVASGATSLIEERNSLVAYQDQLDQTLALMQAQPRIYSAQVQLLLEQMPQGLTLTSLSVTPDYISMTASAKSIRLISAYEYKLKTYPFLTQVFIDYVSAPSADGTHDFTIDISLEQGDTTDEF